MTAIFQRLFNVRRDEVAAVLVSALFVFCILTALMVLRPAREALGMQRGIEALRWLFIGTAVASIEDIDAPFLTRGLPSLMDTSSGLTATYAIRRRL